MARVHVRVQPGARANRWVGWFGDLPKLAVTAPPADGAANEMVAAEVARLLGVRPRQVLLRFGMDLFVLGQFHLIDEVRVGELPRVADRHLDRAEPVRVAHVGAGGGFALDDDIAELQRQHGGQLRIGGTAFHQAVGDVHHVRADVEDLGVRLAGPAVE